MINWFGIIWAAPQYGVIFVWFIVFLALIIWRYRVKKRNAYALAAQSRWPILLSNFSLTKNIIKGMLYLIGIFFLMIALLRPQWGEQERVVEQEGRDVLIALDVSRSMLAKDVEPFRLELAKQKIKQLVALLAAERVGLIIFSGSAVLQCPLTADHAAFLLFLDQLDAETISSGSTAMDEALRTAISVFGKIPTRKNKLLLILTDGEDFSSNLADVKKAAQDMGLHIFTIGVGTPEGAPVPVVDAHGKQAGHQLDNKGNVVISQLNEEMLQALAADAGGMYLRATPGNADIHTILKYVQQFEKEKLDDKKISEYQEKFYYFAAVSLLCFVIEWLL